jgi:hypothetical protein
MKEAIKVYNQNVVLCDPFKRTDDPHVLLINDVTPELLSPDSDGSGTIVRIMQGRDKKLSQLKSAGDKIVTLII